MKKKPVIELKDEKYISHIMEIVMNYEAKMYAEWFRKEGHKLYQKWKEKPIKRLK
jgi:hypothetical protein